MLGEILFYWHMKPSPPEMLDRADVVLSHEFGDQHTLGNTNRALAKLAARESLGRGLPWITQFPQNWFPTKAMPIAVISAHELKKGAYLDTEEVNRQAAEICKVNGWKTVLLCAHPDHAWRAGKNLERHGLSVVYPDLSGISYDPTCARRSLSSRFVFLPRELAARLLYFWKGYLG